MFEVLEACLLHYWATASNTSHLFVAVMALGFWLEMDWGYIITAVAVPYSRLMGSCRLGGSPLRPVVMSTTALYFWGLS